MLQKLMREKRKNKHNGFTLIEIIVAISILAILTANLVPMFKDTSESAKQNKHNENIKTLTEQMQLWSANNKLYATTAIVTGNPSAPPLATIFANNALNVAQTVGTAGGTSLFTTSSYTQTAITNTDGKKISLLLPITEEHPLVKSGYLKSAPMNPWADMPEYKDYVYVFDFIVKKELSKSVDGTPYQQTQVIAEPRLVRIGSTGEIFRDDFIIVSNGKTLKSKDISSNNKLMPSKSERDSYKIYGFDFFSGASGTNATEVPLEKPAIP